MDRVASTSQCDNAARLRKTSFSSRRPRARPVLRVKSSASTSPVQQNVVPAGFSPRFSVRRRTIYAIRRCVRARDDHRPRHVTGTPTSASHRFPTAAGGYCRSPDGHPLHDDGRRRRARTLASSARARRIYILHGMCTVWTVGQAACAVQKMAVP